MIPINSLLAGPVVQFTKVEATLPFYFYCEFMIKGINNDDNIYHYELTASKEGQSLKLDTSYNRPNPEIEIENVGEQEFEKRFEKIMEIMPGSFQLLALAFKQGFELGQAQSQS